MVGVLTALPSRGRGVGRVDADWVQSAAVSATAIRAALTGLLEGIDYSMNQASYDLSRLARNGLIERVPGRNRYTLTRDGLLFACFYTRVYDRILRPLLDADQPPAPPLLRKALRTIDNHIAQTH